LASRQGFGELKTEQLGGHSQEQQRHRQAPIDDDGHNIGSCDFQYTYVNFNFFSDKIVQVSAKLFSVISCKVRLIFGYFITKRVGLQFFFF